MSVNSQLLRKIPKVDELLRLPELSELSCPHTVLGNLEVVLLLLGLLLFAKEAFLF